MPEAKYQPGQRVNITNDITGVCSRIIWDGECWSYECLWWHDGQAHTKEFQANELGK